jgi:lipoprotein-anchoring transpeptidase ErfK/SrfK
MAPKSRSESRWYKGRSRKAAVGRPQIASPAAAKGAKSKEAFTIKPGPNNPAGSFWIGLSAEGYGIHGTPDPSEIGKSESHGCVRLTNWDVGLLGASVKKGTPVAFVGEQDGERAERTKLLK